MTRVNAFVVSIALLSGSACFGQQLASAEVEAAEALQPSVLTSQDLALKDALSASGPHSEGLVAFYEARNFEPLWDDGRKAALVQALLNSEQHGIPREIYPITKIVDMFADPTTPAHQVEAAASDVFMRYATDISSGLLEPRRVDSNIVVAPRRPQTLDLMAQLASATDQKAFFASLAPEHTHYQDLLAEKKRLEALIASGGWGQAVPDGRSLKPGQSAQRIVALRARLERMYGSVHGDSPVYDDALLEAVKEFQIRHGLNDDGVAGPKTLQAINVSATDRLKQVLVNLERQRWLNYDRGERHIYVNQADYSVTIYDAGEATFNSRVVVGKYKHQTQEFNDTMTHMVINPTWHVPRSIATEEMLPKLKRNPGSLGSTMQVMTRNGTRVNPALIDFAQFTKQNFPFIVKQKPGGGNALGRVKFMFPNKYNIYLHDTPAKSLFSRDARAYSHGCVRVQKPFELAHALLALQSDDPDALFQSYLNSGKERRLNLETPVPIYLTYQSAWIDNFGVAQYRDDVYGRDKRVFGALSDLGVSLPTVDG